MQSYPSYKKVPIEWVKTLPSDWSIEPLRFCCAENVQKNKNLYVNDVLSLSYGKVVLKESGENFGLVPESYSSYQVLEPGDIVMRLTDLQNDHVSLRTGLVRNEGIITSAYLGLKIRKKCVNERFFHWLLHSYDIQKVFYGMGGGVRQTVGYNELKWLPVIMPSVVTQRHISDFLDNRVEKINSIIKMKKNIIDLLNEKKVSLIINTITNGIDNSKEIKKSGSEWMGDIPKNWEIKKLKSLFKYHLGGVWGEEKKDNKNDRICVRVADFDFDNFNISTKKLTIRNISRNNSHKELRKGDILLEKSGGGEKTPVGRAVLYDLNKESVCSNFIERMSIKDNECSNFIKYVLAALYFGKLNVKYIKQTTGIQNLDISNYLNEVIPYPEMEIQKEICNFLDEKITKINVTAMRLQNQIKKIEEYRASLIYNAVTGKIKI
jgi:type I restriction enzyme S subunit